LSISSRALLLVTTLTAHLCRHSISSFLCVLFTSHLLLELQPSLRLWVQTHAQAPFPTQPNPHLSFSQPEPRPPRAVQNGSEIIDHLSLYCRRQVKIASTDYRLPPCQRCLSICRRIATALKIGYKIAENSPIVPSLTIILIAY
jgi:hypothetical protein